MNAAETSASSAIADCTPLAVVSRSLITAEIDTFISDVSTTSTNIAMASRTASLGLPDACCRLSPLRSAVTKVLDSSAKLRRYGQVHTTDRERRYVPDGSGAPCCRGMRAHT